MSQVVRRNTPRLSLAVVCDQLEIGGQEAGMFDLVRRLDRARFAVSVYAFRSGPLLRRLRAAGVRATASAPRSRPGAPWTEADAVARATFRRQLPDWLRRDRSQACLVYAWADGVAAAREAGVVAIVERVDGPKLVGWIRDKSSCQRLICESEAIQHLIEAQSDLLRCTGVPISVIRNGVDLERFDPVRYDRARCRAALDLASDDMVVGTIARLAPVKNLGHLLDAVRLLIDRVGEVPPVRVVIAGPDGGVGQELEAQTRRLGLEAHVRFLGPRADVPQILRALDVFVLPSIQEGVSFALLEAMAMGLPLIATQSDSIAETVGRSGYLVAPLDPYRTTLALRELIEQPALRQALGRRSRQQARRHDLTRMVREYERVLLRAVRHSRPLFRRRIVVMSGHPREGRTDRPIDTLFAAIAATGADAYALRLEEGVVPAAAWPPPRRQAFTNTSSGRAARRASLQWIGPDVVITECPYVVQQVRRPLRGEEVVFLPDPDHTCPGEAAAVRFADRILVASGARRTFARRWPQWTWKMQRWDPMQADAGTALTRVLGTARPRRPGPRQRARA